MPQDYFHFRDGPILEDDDGRGLPDTATPMRRHQRVRWTEYPGNRGIKGLQL